MTQQTYSRRLLLSALAMALSLALIGLLGTGLATAMVAADVPGVVTDANAADIVVDFGNGETIVRRVTFTQPTISGLEALQLTDLSLEVADFGEFGQALCGIESVGCPATNCFCNPDKFWGYYFWDGAAWQSYPTGASGSAISDGAVDGFQWGAFDETPPPVSPETLAAEAALQWLKIRQADNGSYGNNTGATLDVVLAAAAANHDPAHWQSNTGNSLLDYLRTAGASYAGVSAAATGKLALGLAAADQDPQDFAGLNLAISLTQYYSPTSGTFGASNQDQALAMLGWQAAGETIPLSATRRLAASANADGGWGWAAGQESDVDSTSLVLQALAAAGEPLTSTAIVSGLAYLDAAQKTNSDGGFPHSPALPWATQSNVNSTAFAIQGLLGAGQDPLAAAWSVSNTHPISYLLSKQLADGAFPYIDPPANQFATQQVVPALTGKPFPYLSRAVALRKAMGWIAAQQQADGSFAGFGTGATIDALLAIVAAGRDPADFVSSAGNTALDFLATQAVTYTAQGASAAGKLAVGVVAAGENPHDFGGTDLVAQIQGYAAGGQYGSGNTWDQAWAMLGLAAARTGIPVSATQYLESIQAADGGWGFVANAAAADVDSTALALQALAAAGRDRDNAAVAAGLAFLHDAQNADGGFPGFLGTTDPASTGLALQALDALDENPRGLAWTTTITDGTASRLTWHTPVDAVLALQSPEGGFPGFSGANDPFSTYQAVPAIAGKRLPLFQPNDFFFPVILRSEAGSGR